MTIKNFFFISICSLGGLLLSSQVTANSTDYYVKGQLANDHHLLVGDPKKWSTAIEEFNGASEGGKVTVTPTRLRSPNDAIRVQWAEHSDRGEVAIYGPPRNLSSRKETDALFFTVKVHSPPTQNVEVSMDCEFPCRANYEIGGILRSLPQEKWAALPIPLSCFKSANFDLSKINGGFLMATAGALDISLADIRVGKTPEGMTECPTAEESDNASPTSSLNPNFFYFANGELINRSITLGDPGKWGVGITGTTGKSASGKVQVSPVTFQTKNDALNIVWNKKNVKGELGIYGDPINIAAYKDVAALTFDIKVNIKPKESVMVGMDCGYPCRAEYEIGMMLRKLKQDTWTSFPIPLNCLSAANFDLTKINAPFLISTSGRLDVSIANIRLERLPEGTKGCAN